MNVKDFRDTLDRLCATNSRNDKKAEIRKIKDTVESPKYALDLLSGEQFNDAGIGKKTVLKQAQAVYGNEVDGKPTVSESLEQFDAVTTADRPEWHTWPMESLYDDMEELATLSGKEQKEYLKRMLDGYNFPSVVSHACLNDLPTGVSDKTIANALDLRDSLPFYDTVVDAATHPNPVTRPTVHKPFDPMLAKSESSLPDDLSHRVAQPKLDGYRLIIHIGNKRVTAFTRQGNDVSDSLPELNEIQWPKGEWIVDTEVIAETGSYADTSERIGRNAQNVQRDIDMEFAVFDVLQFATEPVHNEPFAKRYRYTTTFADLTQDERVGALPIYTDAEKAKTIASDYEGLIWKNINAPYQFGKRSKNWCKQKHTSETADLLAVDFIEGEGRLDNTLGKIELETADGHSIGYTGSGLTDEQRDNVWSNKEAYLGQTLEVEAEAFGEQGSLRFPIFVRWRSDDGEPDSLERVENIMPET